MFSPIKIMILQEISMNLTQFANLSRRKKLTILKSVVESALTEYDINTKKISFYAEHSNVLYKIEDDQGKLYIMKVVRPGDMSYEQLSAYLLWLSHMNKVNTDLLMAKRTKNNDYLATVEIEGFETRYCCLFEWIPGINLRHRLSGKNAFKWGKLLASIHYHSKLCSVPETRVLRNWNQMFYWEEQVLFHDKYHSLMPSKRRAIFQKTAKKVQDAIHRLDPVSKIMIHGDLHLDNVRVNAGKLYALDFEDCMWGHPIQDISIALLYVRARPNYKIIAQRFKEGYSSLLDWPQQYPGEIETFFMGRLLMFANILVQVNDHDDEESIEERFQRYEEEFSHFLDVEIR